jgi:hypothetical protein
MSSHPPTQDDWSPVRPQHAGRGSERRSRAERRHRLWWSFFYGAVRPRRRRVGRVFAILKIAMTGVCVMLMVFLARYRFMRVVRVELLLYGVLMTYLFLVGHELGMLRMLPDRGFY